MPLPDASAAVLIEYEGAGVFHMAVTTGGGLSVRLGIEKPMGTRDVAKLCFIPGHMCLHPGDSGDVVFLGENTLP